MEFTTFEIEELKKENEYAQKCREKAMNMIDSIRKPSKDQSESIRILFDQYMRFNCEEEISNRQQELEKAIKEKTLSERIIVKED